MRLVADIRARVDVAGTGLTFFEVGTLLAGRQNNQAGAFTLQNALDHRNTKSQSLAGAGLGDTHDVLAFDGNGDGLVLDRRGLAEAQFFDHNQQIRCYAERAEARILWLRNCWLSHFEPMIRSFSAKGSA